MPGKRARRVWREAARKRTVIHKWVGTSPCSPPYNLGGCRVMVAQKRYPDELRDRAVKLVFEIRERDARWRGR